MASLTELRFALLEDSAGPASSASRQRVSDAQYDAGMRILLESGGWSNYEIFIIPQLSRLLESFVQSRSEISILEIGPGPQTVLGHLPLHLRQKISKYAAVEPNMLFVSKLNDSLQPASGKESLLPQLKQPPQIHPTRFTPDTVLGSQDKSVADGDQKFDVVLFCHSLYGMREENQVIRRALEMLSKKGNDEMVVVFHRTDALHLEGLVCQQTINYPYGHLLVPDQDDVLDGFAAFMTGFVPQQTGPENPAQARRREVCRALSGREKESPGRLFLSYPNTMMKFTKNAIELPKLTEKVPLVHDRAIDNREARRHTTAFIVRPNTISQIQQCIHWALEHQFSLNVISGGHSDHCLQPNVVSIDMAAFDEIHVPEVPEYGPGQVLIAVGAGCQTGDIIRKTTSSGVTVPLGSCPTVGAGQWLQGGTGHLSRMHGLTSDFIVGAVLVSPKSGSVLAVGTVPDQYLPNDAIRPENETELLWALKGAGTNFGVVVTVVFETRAEVTHFTQNWVVSLNEQEKVAEKLVAFDRAIVSRLPRDYSVDMYLRQGSDCLHLGVTLSQSVVTSPNSQPHEAVPSAINEFLDREFSHVNANASSEVELSFAGMDGKISSFKRCVFFTSIGELDIIDALLTAVENRPSSLCYLHLLHGGGAVPEVDADATAFGCRNWTLACVITGVWPRDQDDSAVSRSAVRWVFDTANKMLPLASGVYGADLGPDLRDANLAAKAFGSNRERLMRLKHAQDPFNVLAYTCPLS